MRSVRDGYAFATLKTEWDALLDNSRAGLFNSWEWLYPWYRRVGPTVELLILTARDERGALVGVMPLCLSTVKAGGRQLRRLGFLGDTHVGSDYLDVVAREGLEEEVTRAFVEAIFDAHGGWDVLELSDMEMGSHTVRALHRACDQTRFQFSLRERCTCPFERFAAGEPFDVFLRRTARRDNYLRRKRWLEKQAGFVIERVEEPGALVRPMTDFFRLHRLRWARDGGSSGIRGPAVEAFHRDAAALLAERGQVCFFTLRVDGQPLASVYGLVHRDKFIYYQSGYDPAWRGKSVGLVLVGETFRAALAAGLRELDFLRGTEAYKADWTTQVRKTVALRIHARDGKGAWLSRQEESSELFRTIAKRALPAPVVEAIRRVRRRKGP
ncbi:MAG: GNAT family N-acetyltransferase [Myxococcota bacterium]